jgi:hypothetical protein
MLIRRKQNYNWLVGKGLGGGETQLAHILVLLGWLSAYIV